MKNKKLNLDNLSVSSFVTSLEKEQSETINGGILSISFCGPQRSLNVASMCGGCSHHVCENTYDTHNGKNTCAFLCGVSLPELPKIPNIPPISAARTGGRCPGEM